MNKTKIIFGIGMVLAVLAVLTAPAAADYNIFHLVPEDSSCDPSEDVTVWVKVNTSYNDINGVQASIIFDPSIVNVTNVVEGANPDWYMWDWHIFNLHGYTYVKITAADPMGAFGPGELDIGKMTLHCEAPGISSLHFANASEVTEEDMNTYVTVLCLKTLGDEVLDCDGEWIRIEKGKRIRITRALAKILGSEVVKVTRTTLFDLE